MKTINPQKVIQQRLADGMSLAKYKEIETAVWDIDVSCDAGFQHLFNGFYKVRRNCEWRAEYYQLFENIKQSKLIDFSLVLDELFSKTGNVEASFSSKMVATLNPEMPIWDKYVIQNLGLEVPGAYDALRIQKIKDLYSEISEWYGEFLETENAKECIAYFNSVLPDYTWLSSIKKIDYYLWSIR